MDSRIPYEGGLNKLLEAMASISYLLADVEGEQERIRQEALPIQMLIPLESAKVRLQMARMQAENGVYWLRAAAVSLGIDRYNTKEDDSASRTDA